jgi:hypothetical protein
MKSFYCTGITTVLYFCCSDLSSRFSRINYVQLESRLKKIKSSEIKKKSQRKISLDEQIDLEKKYIIEIANFFKKEIVFHHLDNIMLVDNDLVTGNLIRYFLPSLRGQKLYIFPEGTSCLTPFTKKTIFSLIYSFLSNIFKSLFIGKYVVVKKYLLPDKDDDIERYLKKFNYKSYSIISSKLFYKNISNCSKYFQNKYPDINISNHSQKIVFHPVIENLDKKIYEKWFLNFKKKIIGKKLLIKEHPTFYNNCESIFKEFDYFYIPEKYITIPGELIIGNLDCEFLGYYTTMLLCFKNKDITLIKPPDKKITNFYLREYRGYRSIKKNKIINE